MSKSLQILAGVLVVLIIIVGVSLVFDFQKDGSPQSKKITGKVGDIPKATTTEVEHKAKTKPVVKIGAVLPMTGAVAFLGEGSQNAINLAIDQLGDTKYEYKVYFEDDQLNPKMTSTAANKLISVNGVDALISISSGTGNVVTPIANQYKVVHMGMASDANVAKGLYNFIHWTTPEEESRVWAQEAVRRGYSSVALLGVNQQGEVAIVNALEKELLGTDVKVVAEEIFNSGEKDFRSVIMKVKKSNPDIYMLAAFSPEVELLVKQMRELGITAPISAIEAPDLTEEKDLFEGEWYVSGADASDEFAKDYKQKYGEDWVLGAPNNYDNFNLLVNAFEAAGDGKTVPTTTEVALELQKIRNFHGAMGNLRVQDSGIVWSPATVRTISNGQPVTIA